mmetsp:Transcript_15942/g.25815  ORF Transcript_15942/g.25815 Transcript_15942/m.25815 type:complete len:205 (-) Transcript_15942:68-682(-)
MYLIKAQKIEFIQHHSNNRPLYVLLQRRSIPGIQLVVRFHMAHVLGTSNILPWDLFLHNRIAMKCASNWVLDVASIRKRLSEAPVITGQPHPSIKVKAIVKIGHVLHGHRCVLLVEISPKLKVPLCVVGVVVVTIAPLPIPSTGAVALAVIILGREGGLTHVSNAGSGAHNRVLDAASPAQMGLVAGRVQLPSKSLQPTLTLRP